MHQAVGTRQVAVLRGVDLRIAGGTTMDDIVAQVRRVSELITHISEATAEQTDGIGQVNGAVGHLDQTTQQNAALVEQGAASAEQLRYQAERLAEVVRVFRMDTAAPARA